MIIAKRFVIAKFSDAVETLPPTLCQRYDSRRAA